MERRAYYNLEKICPICSKPFEAARSSRKYCSDECRQAAKRDRDNLDGRVLLVMQLLGRIARTPQKRSYKVYQLNKIKEHIEGILANIPKESIE